MVGNSFANIVKTNNGFFKSQAQAKFLLSQCVSNQFSTSGSVHGNRYILFYVCDETGVIRVEKQTQSKGLITTWERRQEGLVTIQDEKEIKRLKREIKSTIELMKARERSLERGEYKSLSLYEESVRHDEEVLKSLKEELAKYE